MTTRATLKADILADLGDDQFSSSYIEQAIGKAIEFYQHERLYFNESRSYTFSTVESQVWYSESDDADIGLIKELDALVIETSTYDRVLDYIEPRSLENWTDANAADSEPTAYTYYNKQIGLYPIPDDAYTIRMMGSFKVAAPATDAETDNAWMLDGYDLIRARALADIAIYRQHDFDLAQAFKMREQEELKRLRVETEKRWRTGRLVPMDL